MVKQRCKFGEERQEIKETRVWGGLIWTGKLKNLWGDKRKARRCYGETERGIRRGESENRREKGWGRSDLSSISDHFSEEKTLEHEVRVHQGLKKINQKCEKGKSKRSRRL